MNNIIKTFGCRLNIFETEVIKNFITKNKMKNVSVLNTCAVTKEAEKKAREELSRKGDPMAKGGVVEKRVKFAKPSNFKGTF